KVVARFLAQEETLQHLEEMRSENEEALVRLKEEKEALQAKLQNLKYSGEAQLISTQNLLKKLRGHLEQEEARRSATKAELDKMTRLLLNAKSGVEHLASKVQHIKLESSRFASTQLDEKANDYVLDLLGQTEEKLLHVMQSLGDRDQAELLRRIEEVEFHSKMERRLPSYNTRVKLPVAQKADMYYDEEDSGEDDAGDVVTRAALKRQSQQIIEAKTKRRTRYRKKEGNLEGASSCCRWGLAGPEEKPTHPHRIIEMEGTCRTPLQQWGEEAEEGAVYSIVLERVRAEQEAGGPSPRVDPNLPGCPFVHYRTCKRRLLRAATLPALVRWLLASGAEGDPGFLPSFLATYQAFATLEQVLELLLPLWPDRAVLRVLELWLRDHPEDFWEPPEHPSLQRTLLFLRQLARGSSACVLAESLLQAHKKQEEEEAAAACGRDAAEADGGAYTLKSCHHAGGEAPGVGPPEVMAEAAGPGSGKESSALLSFAVEEVAEQLTLLDSNLFRAVRPFHCLGCVWSQRDKKEKQHVAPSVRATVAQFNAVTSCVVTSVLEDLTLRVHQRAHLLEKWIDIAQHCRTLRNFSSLYAILSALQSNPIYRLKRTWAAVSRNARSSFHKLSEIFSEDNNHLNCREILLQDGGGTVSPSDGCSSPQMPARTPLKPSPPSRQTPPTVPYLGTFLTDLIMLDTALPDFVEGNLINFEKRRKEAETLALIRQLQESCRGCRISRVIEPPASSCPNSPKLHRSLTKRFSSLLLGSDASAPLPSLDRAGLSLPGSIGSLHSGEGLGTSCCLAQGDAPSKASPQVEGGGESRPSPTPLPVLPTQDLPAPQPSPSPPPRESAPPPPASWKKHSGTGTESRIIRVSLDDGCGNLYRSIVITSQDKAAAVVRRALQKHNLGEASLHDYRLLQRLADGQELLIPSGANAFYAMNPASPCDFLLRHKEEAARPGSRATRPSTPTSRPQCSF
ncbi:UNVERIFIED_CONTAM: hypothetical protein K2H54_054113, partial [Gekko kuhli]